MYVRSIPNIIVRVTDIQQAKRSSITEQTVVWWSRCFISVSDFKWTDA